MWFKPTKKLGINPEQTEAKLVKSKKNIKFVKKSCTIKVHLCTFAPRKTYDIRFSTRNWF